MRELLVFYLAKLLEEQIKRGEDWRKLHQVVSIVICDHDLLPEERAYVNAYELRNGRTNKSFTDLIKLIILEIPKLSQAEEGGVWPWLKLFTCRKKEQYEEPGRRHPEVTMEFSETQIIAVTGLSPQDITGL
jgi:predicted transposase/invertase (TIGR01784 family)